MTADGKLITLERERLMTADGGAFLCAFRFFFPFFLKAILSFFEKLMTADGGADYRGGKGS